MNHIRWQRRLRVLADYVIKHFPAERRRIAVSYDSRIKSDLLPAPLPVCLRHTALQCTCIRAHAHPLPVAGVRGITLRGRHHGDGIPQSVKYNGYKVYGADGCQITTEAAAAILAEIEKLDVFADVKRADFDASLWRPANCLDRL